MISHSAHLWQSVIISWIKNIETSLLRLPDRESFLQSEPNKTLQVYIQKHWNNPLKLRTTLMNFLHITMGSSLLHFFIVFWLKGQNNLMHTLEVKLFSVETITFDFPPLWMWVEVFMQIFYMMMMSVSGWSRSLTCVKTGAETVIDFQLCFYLCCCFVAHTHTNTHNTLRFQGVLFCFLFGSE